MEQTLEILCEKLGVTVDALVNELYRYNTTLCYITLIFWTLAVIITVILTIIFKSKWEELIKKNDWYMLLICIPIVIGLFAIIEIPSAISDLMKWHISPISQTIITITK